jgi:RNA polymerase sigma factor (TIGR02999 family)
VAEPIGDVTRLLRELRKGDHESAERLIAAVYGELRQVAARAMRHERPGHTLQPTALVNEVFLRLAGASGIEWRDRAHFFGVSARLMREILVDYARKQSAGKREENWRANDPGPLMGVTVTVLSGMVTVPEICE